MLLASFGFTHSFLVALGLIACVGCAETLFVERCAMLAQSIAPDHLRGRIMSVSVLFIAGSVPLDHLLMGWLTSRFGAPAAVLVGATLTLVMVGAEWLIRAPAAHVWEETRGLPEKCENM
jgi:hypothetical protein